MRASRGPYDELGLVADGVDRGELVLEGLEAELFGAVFVDEAVVEVGDFVCVGTGGGVGLGGFFDDGAKVGLGLVAKLVERAVGGSVGGDFGGLDPAAVDVKVEVVLGTDVVVKVREFDAETCAGRRRPRPERREG